MEQPQPPPQPVKKKGGKRTSVRAPSSTSATAVPGSKPQIITDIRKHDILMGRGAPTINYQGNVSFRELVSTRKAEYTASGRHKIKDEIARQVIEEIARRDGRFLRKVETTAEAEALGIPDHKKAWIIADDIIAMEKVKQALRDKDPVRSESPDGALDELAPGIPMNPNGSSQSSSLPAAAVSSAQMPQLADSSAFSALGASNLGMVSTQPDPLLHLMQQQQQQSLGGHATGSVNPMLEQQYMELIQQRFAQQQRQAQSHGYFGSLNPGLGSLAEESLRSFRNQQGSQQDAFATNSLFLEPTISSAQPGLSEGDYQQAALSLLRNQQIQAAANQQVMYGQSSSSNQLDDYRMFQNLASYEPQSMNLPPQQDLGVRNPNLFSTNGLASVIGAQAGALGSLQGQAALLRSSNLLLAGSDSFGANQLGGSSVHGVASRLNDNPEVRFGNIGAASTMTNDNSLLTSLLQQQAATAGSSAAPLLLTPAPSQFAVAASTAAPEPAKPPTPPRRRTSRENIHPSSSSSEEDRKPQAKRSSKEGGDGSSSVSTASSAASSKEIADEPVRRKKARTTTS